MHYINLDMLSEDSQPFAKRHPVRGQRISAYIVAMSSDSVEAYELSVGSTNSSTVTFFDFVRGSLIPTMQPFPNRHSIIV
jgi:hypothetical protein